MDECGSELLVFFLACHFFFPHFIARRSQEQIERLSLSNECEVAYFTVGKISIFTLLINRYLMQLHCIWNVVTSSNNPDTYYYIFKYLNCLIVRPDRILPIQILFLLLFSLTLCYFFFGVSLLAAGLPLRTRNERF